MEPITLREQAMIDLENEAAEIQREIKRQDFNIKQAELLIELMKEELKELNALYNSHRNAP